MGPAQCRPPAGIVPEHCFVCCYAWVPSLVPSRSQQHGHALQDVPLWLELSQLRLPDLYSRHPSHPLEPSWPGLAPLSCSPTRLVRLSHPTRCHYLTHCQANMQEVACHLGHASILVRRSDLRQALGSGYQFVPRSSQYSRRMRRHSKHVRYKGLLFESQAAWALVAHGSEIFQC